MADVLELHAKKQHQLLTQCQVLNDESLGHFMHMIITKLTSDPDTARWHFKSKQKKCAAYYPHLFGIYKSDMTEQRKSIVRQYTSDLINFYNTQLLDPVLRTLTLNSNTYCPTEIGHAVSTV
jgi:hypothetical protein